MAGETGVVAKPPRQLHMCTHPIQLSPNVSHLHTFSPLPTTIASSCCTITRNNTLYHSPGLSSPSNKRMARDHIFTCHTLTVSKPMISLRLSVHPRFLSGLKYHSTHLHTSAISQTKAMLNDKWSALLHMYVQWNDFEDNLTATISMDVQVLLRYITIVMTHDEQYYPLSEVMKQLSHKLSSYEWPKTGVSRHKINLLVANM